MDTLHLGSYCAAIRGRIRLDPGNANESPSESGWLSGDHHRDRAGAPLGDPVLSKNRNDTKPGPFGGVWALGSGASQPIEHDL
jgi:hypothetical protein